MGNSKRLKDHKQQGMRRRLRNGKKPMSEEQKETQKKMKETSRELNKKFNPLYKVPKKI